MKIVEKAVAADYYYDQWNSINDCKKRFYSFNGDPTKMALIPPDVARSWIRTKKWGIDPAAARIQGIEDHQALQGLLASNELFIETAEASINRFNRLLFISHYCIFITDQEGTVLFSQRHHSALEKEICFRVGAILKEKAIGTTATCLSIANGKPYQLLGPCNYLELFKDTMYSSVPIFNPGRELIGTIAIVHALGQEYMPDLNGMVLNWLSAMAENIGKNMELLLINSDKPEPTSDQSQNVLLADQNRISVNNEFYCFSNIIGRSSSIKRAVSIAKKTSHSTFNILLHGESGTGKDLFAQAMHQSACPEGPFIALNCAALPKHLLESELFGYEGGAFTGAEKKGRPGKFELAHGGTIFLDEIGDMPLELQPVLLRVLEEKKIMRLGGTKYVLVNCRVIAATHRNLLQRVQENRFRDDLYYRLSAFTIEIPPLRERGQDVLLLAEYYLEKICRNERKKVPVLSEESCKILKKYP